MVSASGTSAPRLTSFSRSTRAIGTCSVTVSPPGQLRFSPLLAMDSDSKLFSCKPFPPLEFTPQIAGMDADFCTHPATRSLLASKLFQKMELLMQMNYVIATSLLPQEPGAS